MSEVYTKLETVFDQLIQFLVLMIELVGVCVLIWAIVRAVIQLFQHQERLRLNLAEGIALSLEFKMGGELLRTVIVREWNELLMLGAVIVMRAALTFLIQWEIKVEEKKRVENTSETNAKTEQK